MGVLYHAPSIILGAIPMTVDLAVLVEAPIPVTTTVTCWWVANQLLACSATVMWEIADFSWFFALTDLLVDHHILGHSETMAHDSRIAICLDPVMRTLMVVFQPPLQPDRPSIDREAVRILGMQLAPSALEQTIHALQPPMEHPDTVIDDTAIDRDAPTDALVADAFLQWCQQWCQAHAHEN